MEDIIFCEVCGGMLSRLESVDLMDNLEMVLSLCQSCKESIKGYVFGGIRREV